jgi:hypothetical protein
MTIWDWAKIKDIIKHPDRLFIGGEWVASSSTSYFNVISLATEELFLAVAEAKEQDINRAVAVARFYLSIISTSVLILVSGLNTHEVDQSSGACHKFNSTCTFDKSSGYFWANSACRKTV